MSRYLVVLERGARTWSAYVPDLPGCVATDRDRGARLDRVREAIAFHMEGMRQQGEAVPQPLTDGDHVEVA
jgi:predicted RNase H-like HicB family nuclease